MSSCCIFCGSDDMSEEHLIADWVFRAFARSRRPGPLFKGVMAAENELRLESGEPILTARVVCKTCNNGWMSGIDRAAAEALKPLIQGRTKVTLTHGAQAAVAAWAFKSAVILDASQRGDAGSLVTSRPVLSATKSAPPGCTIYVGPTVPTPFQVDAVPEVAGLAIFGVKETQGVLNLSGNIQSGDGASHVFTSSIPTPGYIVTLGHLQAIISGVRGPIVPTPDQGFVCIWPASESPITVTSAPP